MDKNELEDVVRRLWYARARMGDIRGGLSHLLEEMARIFDAVEARKESPPEQLVEELIDLYEVAIRKIDVLDALAQEAIDKMDEALEALERMIR